MVEDGAPSHRERERFLAAVPIHLDVLGNAIREMEQSSQGEREVLLRLAATLLVIGERLGYEEVAKGATALLEADPSAGGEMAKPLDHALRALLTSGRNSTILIVEDEETSALLIQDALAEDGRTLLMAASAREAREFAVSDSPDAIVLDLVLPDADGRILLAEFRSRQSTREIPIIVLSAKGGGGTKTECFAYGADLFLEKPVEPGVLGAAISSLLARGNGGSEPLTELMSRSDLQSAFSRLQEQAESAGSQLSLALLDVEPPIGTGSLQDPGALLAGHLRELVAELRTRLTPREILGRWSVDQLVLLSPDRTPEETVELLRSVRDTLSRRGSLFRGGVQSPRPSADFMDSVAASGALAVQARREGSSPILHEPGGQPHQPMVVLAEDDPLTATLVVHRLERSGLRVIHHTEGAAALATILSTLPAVAILDVQMPGMSGFEVLARMKDDPKARSVRTIIFTGLGKESDLSRAFDLGADDYLTKPFSPGELVARVLRLARDA